MARLHARRRSLNRTVRGNPQSAARDVCHAGKTARRAGRANPKCPAAAFYPSGEGGASGRTALPESHCATS
ncbi:hypothetical protein [Arsenophonus endosymbiont of Crataerina pallida]|uniref:hypothetical protein n=1 Tax=Arsenophonus endosymbiont of Crataerina pallida TaxID=3066235 RepID=UPI0030D5B4BD